jgi:hypothetical protein
MKKRKHVSAIFIYDDNVSIFLNDALAFYNAISTAPGNSHVTISAADIAAAKGRVATAQASEVIVGTHAKGTADQRDIDVQAVITDVQNFVALVQIAANNAPNEATAIEIVHECGLFTRKPAIKTKNEFDVRNDVDTPGSIYIIFKAAPKNISACYETQESTDGINWVTAKTSPDSHYHYTHNKPAGTKLYYRGRVILSEKNGGAQKWLMPSETFIFVR